MNNGSLGKNMYAYCENNPANLVDYSGCFAASIGALLAGTVKKFVVTVAKKWHQQLRDLLQDLWHIKL